MFENEVVRKIIVGVIVMGLLFFGARLRSKKDKDERFEKMGKRTQIISIINGFLLIVSDFQIENYGTTLFAIALAISVFIDLIFFITLIPHLKKVNNEINTDKDSNRK
ncbi:MAG: hypothetical protein WC123_01890 [Bacilli bacterium]|nr:hypothetical protein [Bacilli bacterium]